MRCDIGWLRWGLNSSALILPVPKKELILIARLGSFFSPGDEKACFDWLQSIPCVGSIGGRLRDIHIGVKKPPSNSELRELLALFYRYRIDMRPLAAFKNKRNAAWFAEDRDTFWYARVFGKRQSTNPS
jgi:hypothetical protein